MLPAMMQVPFPAEALETCRDGARRHDPQRFLLSLFMPPPMREAFWVLTAFNIELSRAGEMSRESYTGLIRLKWWQEVLEQIQQGRAVYAHPVSEALAPLLQNHPAMFPRLHSIITARERDIQPETFLFATPAERDAYAEQTGGALLACCATFDPGSEDTWQAYGTALAKQGLLRALPYYLRQSRCPIPATALNGQDPLNLPHEQWRAILQAELAENPILPKPKTAAQRAANRLWITHNKRLRKNPLLPFESTSPAPDFALLLRVASAAMLQI